MTISERRFDHLAFELPALTLARLVGYCEARGRRLAALAGGGLQAKERSRLRELAASYDQLGHEIRRLAVEHGVCAELIAPAVPSPGQTTERVIVSAVEHVLESDLPVALRRAVFLRFRAVHRSSNHRRASTAPPSRSGILAG